MKIELIMRNELQPKLQKAVESLKRDDIKIIDIRPVKEKIPGKNNSIFILESQSTESIFFAGMAFGLPEKKDCDWIKRKLKSWKVK